MKKFFLTISRLLVGLLQGAAWILLVVVGVFGGLALLALFGGAVVATTVWTVLLLMCLVIVFCVGFPLIMLVEK